MIRIHIGVLKGELHREVLQYNVQESTKFVEVVSWRMHVGLLASTSFNDAQYAYVEGSLITPLSTKANTLLLTHVSLSNIPYKLTLCYVNDTSLAYIQVFAKTEAEFIISWMPCLLGLQMQFIRYRAVTLSVPWPFKKNERQIWSLIFKNCRCLSIAYTCTWALELR